MSQTEQWEYKTITANTQTEFDKTLNALGVEGWEAIQIKHVSPVLSFLELRGFASYYEATLKRRKLQD
jgi:hypothetical protein